MSGFGLKKALNISNKQNEEVAKSEYYDFIILGDHFLIPKLYNQIKANNPTAKVILISGNSFFNLDYLNQEASRFINNPCSEIEAKYFESKESLGIKSNKLNASVFYKDSKLNPFGGRVKSFELKGKETKIKDTCAYLSFDQNIRSEKIDQSIEDVNKIRKYDFPEQIEFVAPTDLINQSNVRIKLKSQKIIEGQNLINFENPKVLEKLIKVDERSLRLIEALALIKAESYISLLHEVTSDNDVGNLLTKDSLYFIPQSTVYENGHYMLLMKDTYLLSYFFIDEDLLVNEEDIAKKIRHFKGAMNRVFPGLKEKLNNEKIFVNHNSYFSITEQDKLLLISDEYSYFYNFINLDISTEEKTHFESKLVAELERFQAQFKGESETLNNNEADDEQKNCLLSEMSNNIEASIIT
ncbi:hypothetical protein N9N67_05465 [Bacteriovoracaceae bacterium]|nr:hypothetical protein [Bacteriovoracaceae bacterium]